jgi:hypothetical protein
MGPLSEIPKSAARAEPAERLVTPWTRRVRRARAPATEIKLALLQRFKVQMLPAGIYRTPR